MRLLSTFLSLLLLLQFTCWLPASDAAASYDAATGVKAEGVPVNKIGALLLTDAVAFLNGDTIEVQGKGPDNSGQNLLTGKLSDVHVSGGTIEGNCEFSGGSKLGALCPKGGSACKFKFAMPMAGTRISFTHLAEPTAAKPPKQPKQHTTHVSSVDSSTTKKIVCTALVLGIVACAIAIPIAVACGSKRRGNRNNTQNAILLQNLIAARHRQAPPPVQIRAVPSGPALPEPNLIPVVSGP